MWGHQTFAATMLNSALTLLPAYLDPEMVNYPEISEDKPVLQLPMNGRPVLSLTVVAGAIGIGVVLLSMAISTCCFEPCSPLLELSQHS